MRRSSTTMRLAGAGVVFALLGAACAGSGQADSTASSPQDREEAVLAFAQCMREQGVDMPDPQVDESGRVGIVRPHRGQSDEGFEDAREACSEFLERGLQEHDPGHATDMQDRALAFAQCMRSNGVDMPDPDLSGGPRMRFNPFGDVDIDDPDVRSAIETCREEAFGGRGPGGPMIGRR